MRPRLLSVKHGLLHRRNKPSLGSTLRGRSISFYTLSVPLNGDVRSFDLTIFKEAIMSTFAVVPQRYADELTLTTIVEAATEYLASCKV